MSRPSPLRSLLRRARRKVGGGGASVRLLVEPPKPVGEGWLLRLRCQNPGAPGTFDAEIVGIEPDVGVELPWALAWRGHAASAVSLQTRGGELLRLAVLRPGTPARFELLGAADDGIAGRQELRAGAVDPDVGIVLTVRIRRAGRTEVQQQVRLSTRAGTDGTPVPRVTIIG